MRLAAWSVVLLAGMTAGALTCAALVVRRRAIALLGVAATLCIIALIGSGSAAWNQVPTPDTFVALVLIAAGALGGGYALAAALLPGLTDRRRDSAATPLPVVAGDRFGVVVLAEAEPETYDPQAVGALLGELEDLDIALPPTLARPLVYAAERSQYARRGSSPARQGVREIARGLAARVGAPGAATAADVTVAFCDEGPTLASAIADLVEVGCSRVVVAPLAVGASPAMAEAVAAAQARAKRYGLAVELIDPLWSSPQLTEMIADRVVGRLDGHVAEIGVCLISAGDPRQMARRSEGSGAETTYFAQRVRSRLIEAGIAEERVRRAWLEWDEPDVPEVARHLAAVGARVILFVPLDFPTESLQTLVDLDYLAKHATADTGSECVVLPAWGADPLVIEALEQRVRCAMSRWENAAF